MGNLAEIKGINRTNDYAFKRIFGSEEGKEALLAFLNAVLKSPPGQELVHIELLDREIDPQYLLDRGARLDVLARTEAGTLVNIEVQVANQYNIDKRTLYYWAGLYHGQLARGQQFTELCQTITINVLAFNWFRRDESYHRTFHVRDDANGELLCDDLEIHFLELEKIKTLGHKPQDALEAWMMYLNNLEGEVMEAMAMEYPGIKKALTIEQAFWQSKQERRLYELREKAIRDEISALAGAKAEGEAKGEAKGEARGIATVQEAICKYLDARFGRDSRELQGLVKQIDKLDTLDKIINQIYTAGSLAEARDIISENQK